MFTHVPHPGLAVFQLVSFLQQLVTYRGFYDESLQWISLENVGIVCTMNPPTSVGRFPLAPRFTATVRVVSINYAKKDELRGIYTSFLDSVVHLDNTLRQQRNWTQRFFDLFLYDVSLVRGASSCSCMGCALCRRVLVRGKEKMHVGRESRCGSCSFLQV